MEFYRITVAASGPYYLLFYVYVSVHVWFVQLLERDSSLTLYCMTHSQWLHPADQSKPSNLLAHILISSFLGFSGFVVGAQWRTLVSFGYQTLSNVCKSGVKHSPLKDVYFQILHEAALETSACQANQTVYGIFSSPLQTSSYRSGTWKFTKALNV